VTSVALVPIKEKIPARVVTRPALVLTMTLPGEEEMCEVIGERTTTLSIVCETISAEIPSKVTELMSEPVPSCQPEMVTVKQDAFTTWTGVTELKIPPGWILSR
jgi:hypothetical protein